MDLLAEGSIVWYRGGVRGPLAAASQTALPVGAPSPPSTNGRDPAARRRLDETSRMPDLGRGVCRKAFIATTTGRRTGGRSRSACHVRGTRPNGTRSSSFSAGSSGCRPRSCRHRRHLSARTVGDDDRGSAAVPMRGLDVEDFSAPMSARARPCRRSFVARRRSAMTFVAWRCWQRPRDERGAPSSSRRFGLIASVRITVIALDVGSSAVTGCLRSSGRGRFGESAANREARGEGEDRTLRAGR